MKIGVFCQNRGFACPTHISGSKKWIFWVGRVIFWSFLEPPKINTFQKSSENPLEIKFGGSKPSGKRGQKQHFLAFSIFPFFLPVFAFDFGLDMWAGQAKGYFHSKISGFLCF